MDRKMKIGVAIGILVIIAAGLGWYHFVRITKSPEYAIEVIEKSIVNHDKEKFYEYVDLDNILDTSYDAMIQGMTDSDKNLTDDARDAIKGFTEMIKTPMLVSLKTAIDSYIETGDFHEDDNAGVADILKRTGLDKSEYRGTGDTDTAEDDSQSVADIRVYHPEIGREFTLKFVLEPTKSGSWKVVSIQNFSDFTKEITNLRRGKLDTYLEDSAKIISRHDKNIEVAEKKYNSTLSSGSLANSDTRAKLKKIMADEIKIDWEKRKNELSELDVPKDAQTLQNLRIKICDLEIEYSEGYAQWMDDKQASTVKTAEEKHRRAKTLMTEEAALLKRMN